MSETDNDTQGQKACVCRLLKGRRFAIAAGVTALVFLALWVLHSFRGPLSARNKCAANLRVLAKLSLIYSCGDGPYPTPDKWCDLLMEHADASETEFRCPANKKERCSYAINPNVSPTSNPRLVFLFETEGGWNQFGGPELLSTENHGADGCNIIFNDLHVEWVTSDRFDRLKWKDEEKEEGQEN
ncbi:MAG: hypothetical protein ACYS18_08330 [Planctomycetota bacterium]